MKATIICVCFILIFLNTVKFKVFVVKWGELKYMFINVFYMISECTVIVKRDLCTNATYPCVCFFSQHCDLFSRKYDAFTSPVKYITTLLKYSTCIGNALQCITFSHRLYLSFTFPRQEESKSIRFEKTVRFKDKRILRNRNKAEE